MGCVASTTAVERPDSVAATDHKSFNDVLVSGESNSRKDRDYCLAPGSNAEGSDYCNYEEHFSCTIREHLMSESQHLRAFSSAQQSDRGCSNRTNWDNYSDDRRTIDINDGSQGLLITAHDDEFKNCDSLMMFREIECMALNDCNDVEDNCEPVTSDAFSFATANSSSCDTLPPSSPACTAMIESRICDINETQLNHASPEEIRSNFEKQEYIDNTSDDLLVAIGMPYRSLIQNAAQNQSDTNTNNSKEIDKTKFRLESVGELKAVYCLSQLKALQTVGIQASEGADNIGKTDKTRRAELEMIINEHINKQGYWLHQLELILERLNPLDEENKCRATLLDLGLVEICVSVVNSISHQIPKHASSSIGSQTTLSALAVLVHMAMNNGTTEEFSKEKGPAAVMATVKQLYNIDCYTYYKTTKVTKGKTSPVPISSPAEQSSHLTASSSLSPLLSTAELLTLAWRLIFTCVLDGTDYGTEWIFAGAMDLLMSTLSSNRQLFNTTDYCSWALAALQLALVYTSTNQLVETPCFSKKTDSQQEISPSAEDTTTPSDDTEGHSIAGGSSGESLPMTNNSVNNVNKIMESINRNKKMTTPKEAYGLACKKISDESLIYSVYKKMVEHSSDSLVIENGFAILATLQHKDINNTNTIIKVHEELTNHVAHPGPVWKTFAGWLIERTEAPSAQCFTIPYKEDVLHYGLLTLGLAATNHPNLKYCISTNDGTALCEDLLSKYDGTTEIFQLASGLKSVLLAPDGKCPMRDANKAQTEDYEANTSENSNGSNTNSHNSQLSSPVATLSRNISLQPTLNSPVFLNANGAKEELILGDSNTGFYSLSDASNSAGNVCIKATNLDPTEICTSAPHSTKSVDNDYYFERRTGECLLPETGDAQLAFAAHNTTNLQDSGEGSHVEWEEECAPAPPNTDDDTEVKDNEEDDVIEHENVLDSIGCHDMTNSLYVHKLYSSNDEECYNLCGNCLMISTDFVDVCDANPKDCGDERKESQFTDDTTVIKDDSEGSHDDDEDVEDDYNGDSNEKEDAQLLGLYETANSHMPTIIPLACPIITIIEKTEHDDEEQQAFSTVFPQADTSPLPQCPLLNDAEGLNTSSLDSPEVAVSASITDKAAGYISSEERNGCVNSRDDGDEYKGGIALKGDDDPSKVSMILSTVQNVGTHNDSQIDTAAPFDESHQSKGGSEFKDVAVDEIEECNESTTSTSSNNSGQNDKSFDNIAINEFEKCLANKNAFSSDLLKQCNGDNEATEIHTGDDSVNESEANPNAILEYTGCACIPSTHIPSLSVERTSRLPLDPRTDSCKCYIVHPTDYEDNAATKSGENSTSTTSTSNTRTPSYEVILTLQNSASSTSTTAIHTSRVDTAGTVSTPSVVYKMKTDTVNFPLQSPDFPNIQLILQFNSPTHPIGQSCPDSEIPSKGPSTRYVKKIETTNGSTDNSAIIDIQSRINVSKNDYEAEGESESGTRIFEAAQKWEHTSFPTSPITSEAEEDTQIGASGEGYTPPPPSECSA